MCTRYSLMSPPEAIRRLFDLDTIEDFPPRYNIAPAAPVLIVRQNPVLRTAREAVLVRWGLIPAWVKDPRDFATIINARSETAAEKPSFRGALRHKRCLIPASGFYEWTGAKGAKQPYSIQLKSGAPMALAGLYDHWLGADGSELETMAILTTAANASMAAIHDRMPVLIAPEQFDRWLDCRAGTADGIGDLLAPLADGLLTMTAVNPKLNNPRAEGPDLIEAFQPPRL